MKDKSCKSRAKKKSASPTPAKIFPTATTGGFQSNRTPDRTTGRLADQTTQLKPKTQLIAVGLGALLALPLHAQDDLRTKVDELEQQLRILKRQLELDREASAEKAKTTPIFSAGSDGLIFRSADTNFLFRIRAYLQADARFYPGDPAPGAANDTFLVRRARTSFEGTVWEKFDYRLLLDFGGGQSFTTGNNSILQDAYVNARLEPWLQIGVGKFKVPLSLERVQTDQYLSFVERAYTSQLAPNRDVGVQLQGDLFNSRLTYSLGVFNGVPDGGSGDLEATDDDKEVVARLFATPFVNGKIEPLRGLGFGVAGSIGNQQGPLRSFVSAGQQTMFSYSPTPIGTNAPTVTANGQHWRLAPQAYYYIGPFGLSGEYVISDQKVRRTNPSTAGRVQNTAWTVTASYFLTGEKNGFKPPAPKHPFRPSEGGWGAFELVARLQHLDIDDDAFPLYASPASSATEATTWGVGLNWYLNRNFKLNFNYENSDFQGGTSALLSRNEQAILTRAQVSF
jgi:phosphate-selective porin OprO/OprP